MRRHKYGARKTMVDNINFDSAAEARYYQQLKLLKRAGEVIDFDLQPVYTLVDGFTKNGKKFRPITYRADFLVTYKDGSTKVIDVKGAITKEYTIKRKLFEWRYPDLTIEEVTA